MFCHQKVNKAWDTFTGMVYIKMHFIMCSKSKIQFLVYYYEKETKIKRLQLHKFSFIPTFTKFFTF